jgi:hypothetical protein
MLKFEIWLLRYVTYYGFSVLLHSKHVCQRAVLLNFIRLSSVHAKYVPTKWCRQEEGMVGKDSTNDLRFALLRFDGEHIAKQGQGE